MKTAEPNVKEGHKANRFPVPHRRTETGGPTVWISLVGLFAVAVACAQPNTSAPAPPTTALAAAGPYVSPAQVPAVLLRPYLALGDRLSKPGNERITLQGTITNASGASNVVMVLELGGKLNITWAGVGSQKLVFDGKTPPATASVPNATDLLESFVDDLAENLMLAAPSRTIPRLLGQRFTTATGSLCDYYDIATYGRAVTRQTPVVKRYCFDSKTSLLSSVRYATSASQAVVTEFGGWTTVNKQAVPQNLTRIVGGSQTFHFQAHAAVVSPSVVDTTFAP